MSLTSLLVHDVTLIRAGTTTTTDRYGNVVPSWSTATTVVTKGWIAQRDRSEDEVNRDAQVSDWVLFLLSDADLTGHDRTTWAGIMFDVVGPPLPAWTPRGLHHYEADLRVVEG